MASSRLSLFPRRAATGALVLVLGLALGLAGCGRKGPLDPPPGASLDGANGATPIGGQAVDDDPGVGPDGMPRAPKGPNKRIPLDVLLN